VSRIRVIGRARGGRCVYCHDDLSSEVDRCPQCRAAWHEDCAPAQATRCPTIGCAGPAPARTARPATRRDRARHAARVAGAPPAWTLRRPRPGQGARFWPFWRLGLSGVWNTLVFLGVVAVVLLALSHPAGLWDALIHGKNHHVEPVPVAILKGLCFGAFLLFAGFVSGSWLLRLPAVYREVGHLLERTDPVLMELTVWSTGTGKQRKTHARLTGRPGEQFGDVKVELHLSPIVTPGWLSRARDKEPVLVYGLPPPGPYIIEMQDGELAIVSPDS